MALPSSVGATRRRRPTPAAPAAALDTAAWTCNGLINCQLQKGDYNNEALYTISRRLQRVVVPRHEAHRRYPQAVVQDVRRRDSYHHGYDPLIAIRHLWAGQQLWPAGVQPEGTIAVPGVLVDPLDDRDHGAALVVQEAAQRTGLLLEGAFCRRGHIDTEM